VFDARKEAEMRLYSERLARELALRRSGEGDNENNVAPHAPPLPAEAHVSSVAGGRRQERL
jgi:hypothetical protein